MTAADAIRAHAHEEGRMTYTIDELATITGVSQRTVRYYVERGLIPAPSGRGPTARYDDRHLTGVRFVRQERAAGRTLDEVARWRRRDASDLAAAIAAIDAEIGRLAAERYACQVALGAEADEHVAAARTVRAIEG